MGQTSWADDDGSVLPSPVVTVDDKGIKTVIEYKINEEGKKFKVTKRIETKVIKREVNKSVAERKEWRKFGLERGNAPGPNTDTTTTGENIYLKLNQYGYDADAIAKAEAEAQKEQKTTKNSTIQCRYCKQGHFTAKCPDKDRLATPETLASIINAEDGSGGGAGVSAGFSEAASLLDGTKKGGSSYVPPHMRDKLAGGSGTSSLGGRSGSDLGREEKPTLRLTNLSDTVEEDDLRDLCRRFGFRVNRINVPKSYTGESRGFAFIDFFDHSDADACLEKLNGLPFHNIIIHADKARK
ncbi:translation initiation factor eIF3 subunit g [Mycoemilia scoparia]|uniref:Eukaryotic translation initiation factor 3 subunit G n=1 Tax=Mycoemilia scoparia TaxID=417184 RepID=A0A9W7ZWQ9_9FUNG|nr:translation initiation factor eIF3 subunit g [Mycoemilia scoparia]